jgi:TrpR-related protein YerC/YecD
MNSPLLEQRFQYPNDDTRDLFRVILQLETMEDCEQFFRDLCTLQELKAMTERWHIAKMVWHGFPYRAITQKTGASSTTIARVAHWLSYGQGGYRRACELLKGSMHIPLPEADATPHYSGVGCTASLQS